ncbi:MarR family winged helix-turn-helix transcriptional regulator [Citricoccus sp. K5]|uniref:MarR family winged helix-turn-helix transcriptional regulator n=1 Tax=Citricoccus sp. K5 TaxID=2653135 RepID=UPI001916C350|nr:MarR family transcriptional regulator [Citricoccus sp. K5]
MKSTGKQQADAGRAADEHAVELWGRVINGFEVTNRRIHGAINERFSLSEAEVQVLLNLHRQPDFRAPMAQLARAASFSTGGFTKLADKLTQRGFVSRAACPDDRRVTFLEFTPEGRRLADELTGLAARLTREAFIDVLGQDTAEVMAEAMSELVRANTPPDDQGSAVTLPR